MNKSINKTGILLVFIGLIINLFIGFGAILSLIGLFMSAGQSENIRKSRNSFIGTMCVSVAMFIALIIGGPLMVLSVFSGGMGGAIAFIVITVILCVLAVFFNYNSYKYLLFGCMETVEQGSYDYNSMERCFAHYKRALVLTYSLAIATVLLSMVPILNVILMIAVICTGIYMFVCNIWIIVCVYKAYRVLDEAGLGGNGNG